MAPVLFNLYVAIVSRWRVFMVESDGAIVITLCQGILNGKL